MEKIAANFLFTLLALMTIVPAIFVVVTQNIVRAACWLLLSLTGAAGLFFFLGADFVGATQLLIYVGGTLVLVIFGVMLTATGPFAKLISPPGDWALALVGGAILFGVVGYAVSTPIWKDQNLFPRDHIRRTPVGTTQAIGLAFLGLPAKDFPDAVRKPDQPYSGYLLPFEIVSVHLVIVLVGAAYLARAKRRREEGAT